MAQRTALDAPGKQTQKADGEDAVLEKIAEMPEPYSNMGVRLHSLIMRSAPKLQPGLWYGMPAYRKNGKVICFFRADRYMTFGLTEDANLVREKGSEHRLIGSSWFLTELDDATEDRLSEIVRKAVE